MSAKESPTKSLLPQHSDIEYTNCVHIALNH
jgi:hypothetical protein